MVKAKSKFSAAFTAGALLFLEFNAILPLLEENDFSLLDREAKENALLKIKTDTARVRIVAEVKRRAKVVGKEFWRFYYIQTEHEQKLALFYLVLKSYALALDFQFEVVLRKWKSLDYHLERFDLQMRLDEIASQDDEVSQWTEATHTKLLTVYMRMLREAGLMARHRLKKADHVNPEFWKFFVSTGDSWFLEACFLSKIERENII